jgi:hypothetical protein
MEQLSTGSQPMQMLNEQRAQRKQSRRGVNAPLHSGQLTGRFERVSSLKLAGREDGGLIRIPDSFAPTNVYKSID